MSALDDAGLVYRDAAKLDAQDYGVPQIRTRFLMIASRHAPIALSVNGRPVNPEAAVEALLELLVDEPGRKQRAAAWEAVSRSRKPALSVARQPRRPRQGAIQAAIFAVLEEAGRPLPVREVRVLVEARLGHAVSADTVRSCLSVAAREPGSRVKRVAFGRYVRVG